MGAPPPGTTFGYVVGGIFIFNLVVGTGALALPNGWEIAGLIPGIILTFLIFCLAYITLTFIIEVQSYATAVLEARSRSEKTLNFADEEHQNINSSDHFPTADDGQTHYFTDEKGETAFYPKQVELGSMSEIFLGKGGRYFFYFILMLYLYGDLAIYAVTVPQSIINTVTPNGITHDGEVIIPKFVCYWFYLAIFSCIVLPFSMFTFTNTKYLQFFTIFCRNLAFILMISIAIYWIFSGQGVSPLSEVPLFEAKGLATLWGTIIYCFMCHHSIPGLIAPLQKKRRVNLLMFAVYIAILCFYMMLSSTALFAFADPDFSSENDVFPCQIQSVYTYNFAAYSHKVIAYYLGLFPVFTLTSNFPLIAITLRNNLMKIFPFLEGNPYRQYIFAVIAAVPSLILASFFTRVDVLVSLTGSYAGLFIEFIIPVALVYISRKYVKEHYPGEDNPYKSPFQHWAWLILILIVSAISLVVVTINNVINVYGEIEALVDPSSTPSMSVTVTPSPSALVSAF